MVVERVHPLETTAQPPYHEIRAAYTDTTITVYQAYSDEIGEKALQAQRFVPPFKFGRMTWIKPSFLWIMYRSGWGTKKGQERILAIDISRNGFKWCLDHACLSQFDASVHTSESEWQHARDTSPVRVQFDPERSIRLERLNYRSIQVGLVGIAVEKYVNEWTSQIRDVTSLAYEMHRLVLAREENVAERLRPQEIPYPAYAPHLGLTGTTN